MRPRCSRPCAPRARRGRGCRPRRRPPVRARQLRPREGQRPVQSLAAGRRDWISPLGVTRRRATMAKKAPPGSTAPRRGSRRGAVSSGWGGTPRRSGTGLALHLLLRLLGLALHVLHRGLALVLDGGGGVLSRGLDGLDGLLSGGLELLADLLRGLLGGLEQRVLVLAHRALGLLRQLLLLLRGGQQARDEPAHAEGDQPGSEGVALRLADDGVRCLLHRLGRRRRG